MDWDLAAINRVADDVIITLGIAWLIVRQFVWRSTDVKRMLRMPLFILVAAVVFLGFELWGGFRWVAADVIFVGELVLVGITGSIMGIATQFRTAHGRTQYRLSAVGLWLWVLFVGIRAASFFAASALGANLTDATGLILLSFGVNRLAAILVVTRRVRAMDAATARQTSVV